MAHLWEKWQIRIKTNEKAGSGRKELEFDEETFPEFDF